MAKPCSICTDPRRADIDKSLESLPRHEISRIYNIPKHRIDNHAQNHLRKRAIGGADDGNSGDIATLKAEAQEILDSAKDDKVRLLALQRLQQLHELELRLHQDQPGTGALANDPAFQKLAVALDSGLCSKCVAALDGILEGILGTANDNDRAREGYVTGATKHEELNDIKEMRGTGGDPGRPRRRQAKSTPTPGDMPP